MSLSRTIHFFSLNAIRVIGIISLLLVLASSILVMIDDVIAVDTFLQNAKTSGTPVDQLLDGCDYIEDSTVPNQMGGIVWAVINQLLTITQVIILILSECSWPMPAFDTFFPVLGTGFGLGPLGFFECLIGATILSHFVDDFTLVAAFFLFSIGCLNLLLGLIFGVKAKQKRSFRAWRSETRPGHKGFLISKPLEIIPTNSSPSNKPRNVRPRPNSGSSIYSTSSANAPVLQFGPSR